MPYNNSLWSSMYPELTRILDENPMAPVGNKVQWNLVTTSSAKTQISQPNIQIYSTYANNTFDVPSSIFVDPSIMNFNLISGNVYENQWALYHFTKIPFDDIGLLKNGNPTPSVSVKPMRSAQNSTKNPRASVSMATCKNEMKLLLWFVMVITLGFMSHFL
ncbi:hypothetical protein C9374_012836 [Naegleria lovaniensis]|uniref:Uncharacterized protein n=1 Tax=Naegleria lovaniensis TaxID=51637 RepID=A0AA88GCF2_NAELO|nr:uncharacterized protein C9374_012836 [Naegleria lovaniensis]KAG2373104.1 hypothetical protein C9374_012836 [Naegleria lovaniensis]